MNPVERQILKLESRTDLLSFMQYTWQGDEPMKVGRHTREITDRLTKAVEDFKNGVSTYLIVTVPFRHGKSEIISRKFPTWFFGKNPDCEVMLATYGQDLSDQMSRAARGVMRSREYREVFCREKLEISSESASVKTWGIEGHSGKFQSIGIGGGATGKGAHLLIIDDYLKGRSDAESEPTRKTLWEDFSGNLMTRLAPVHIVVILATPWHVDDLIGRIRNRLNPSHKDHDPDFPAFEFMRFPARQPDGSFLFPERFSDSWYRMQFAALGSYQAAALLQCDPVPRGGNMLKTDRVTIIDAMPGNLRFFRFWDLASTEKERQSDDPDYTAGALCAAQEIKGQWHLYIADVRFVQAEAPARNKLIEDTANSDRASVPIGVESVAGYKDTYTTLKGILKGRRSVHKITVSHDKVIRAAEMEPIFEAGHVYMLRAWWNSAVLDQLAQFPAGTHDDIVDAIGGAFEMARKFGGVSRIIEA